MRMMNETIVGLIAGLAGLFSTVLIVSLVFVHKRYKRTTIWDSPTTTPSVISSAPISRRSSSSCLINLEKPSQQVRSRSASFGEDLTSRLQIIAAGTPYNSYAPTTLSASPRLSRPSLGANTRFPVVSNSSAIIPNKPAVPSITFQLRYEPTIEILFVTVFQLHDYMPANKSKQSAFLILYLLPNDDEQRQTSSSAQGVFNEHFQFQLKSSDLLERTLRFTAYTVDSVTRIRTVLGHLFLKFDGFIKENAADRTFSTATLSECLTSDLPAKAGQLGELVLTHCYLKDQNLFQIRIQELHQLQTERWKSKTPLKGHFSGQTSNPYHKQQWINTSSFPIPSTTSFRIDQELNLMIRPPILTYSNDEQIQCHLRLHLHGSNQIHSHARWQPSLRTNLPQTLTVPLHAS